MMKVKTKNTQKRNTHKKVSLSFSIFITHIYCNLYYAQIVQTVRRPKLYLMNNSCRVLYFCFISFIFFFTSSFFSPCSFRWHVDVISDLQFLKLHHSQSTLLPCANLFWLTSIENDRGTTTQTQNTQSWTLSKTLPLKYSLLLSNLLTPRL